MNRRQAGRLLWGLVPVLAILAAQGRQGDDAAPSTPTTPFAVTHGSALVPNGRYLLDVSDTVATPARITTAGQQIEGLSLHHADFEGFVLFRVDDPAKFAMFMYPGARHPGATTYACRSANWSPSELQAIDDAPEIDLHLAALGGQMPVCPTDVEIDAVAHRIRIRDLPLQRVSAPAEAVRVSTTLQYHLR